MKKHFVKNVDALGEHHGAVYPPTHPQGRAIRTLMRRSAVVRRS